MVVVVDVVVLAGGVIVVLEGVVGHDPIAVPASAHRDHLRRDGAFAPSVLKREARVLDKGPGRGPEPEKHAGLVVLTQGVNPRYQPPGGTGAGRPPAEKKAELRPKFFGKRTLQLPRR